MLLIILRGLSVKAQAVTNTAARAAGHIINNHAAVTTAFNTETPETSEVAEKSLRPFGLRVKARDRSILTEGNVCVRWHAGRTNDGRPVSQDIAYIDLETVSPTSFFLLQRGCPEPTRSQHFGPPVSVLVGLSDRKRLVIPHASQNCYLRDNPAVLQNRESPALSQDTATTA
jgi:hypothetical protein